MIIIIVIIVFKDKSHAITIIAYNNVMFKECRQSTQTHTNIFIRIRMRIERMIQSTHRNILKAKSKC